MTAYELKNIQILNVLLEVLILETFILALMDSGTKRKGKNLTS